MTCRVRSTSTARSSSIRRTRLLRALERKAFIASSSDASASSASNPVIANTSALASSVRRRSHAPIECVMGTRGAAAANTAKLTNALNSFPDAKIASASDFKKNQEQGINTLLNLLYVLLSLSILISLFGIVNTLVLTVFERTRELGMLRAIGMTRRQVRRMIRHESIITALIGAALGIPVGVVLALMVGKAIKYPAFTIPWGTLVVFVIAAILAGLVAAIIPARRAGRLNVLQALQYE